MSDLLDSDDERLIFSLREELFNNVQYKILCNAAKQSVKESSIDPSLAKRVQNIFSFHEVQQALELDSNIDLTLLGIDDLNEEPLNYDESQNLQEAVKKNIIVEELEIGYKLKKMFGDYETSSCLKLPEINMLDNITMEARNDLIKKMQDYNMKLVNCVDVLEQYLKLRQDTLPSVCTNKLKEWEMEMTINECKIRIMDIKTELRILTKNENSKQNYEKASEYIAAQKLETQMEIKRLKEMKEKYNLSTCLEYKEILKSYLEYKDGLERLKDLQKKLGAEKVY